MKPEVAPPAAPTAEDLAPADAVRATLTAGYRAIEAGDAQALAPLFAEDATVIGLGPGDVWSGARLEAGLRDALAPVAAVESLRVTNSRIVVGLADDGGAAWAFDAPRVTVTRGGVDAVWLPRLTAHLVCDGARWHIDALHASLPVAEPERPLPVPVAPIAGPRAAGSDAVVAAVQASLEGGAAEVQHLSERPEGVQLGWSQRDLVVGGKYWRDLLTRNLDGSPDPLALQSSLAPNVRVGLSPGGRSAWVAGVVTFERAAYHAWAALPPRPARALWTLADEGGVWRVTSAHTSFPAGEAHGPATKGDLRLWASTLDDAERTMARSRVGAPAGTCPDGQVQVDVLDGSHCCWPGQAYNPLAGACVGAPECPADAQRRGEGCTRGGGVPPTSASCWEGAAWVDGGRFTMAQRGDEVTVDGFCLDVTKVTVGAYRKFAEPHQAWPCSAPESDGQAMECVTWLEATAYCRSLGKRLPSEEEWEWAARGAAGARDLVGGAPEWTASRLGWTRTERVKRGSNVAGTPAVTRLSDEPTERSNLGFRCAASP